VRLGGPAHVDEWAWYQGPGGGIPIVSGVWPDIRGHETTVLTFHLDQGQYLVATQLIAVNNDGTRRRTTRRATRSSTRST